MNFDSVKVPVGKLVIMQKLWPQEPKKPQTMMELVKTRKKTKRIKKLQKMKATIPYQKRDQMANQLLLVSLALKAFLSHLDKSETFMGLWDKSETW